MEYDSHYNKDAGHPANDSDAKFPNNAAIMQLADGRLIEVHHWFYDDRDRVCVYFEDRKNGIDARYHDDNVEVILESRSAAVHALGMSEEQLNEEVSDA
jgi:hypothetical protein